MNGCRNAASMRTQHSIQRCIGHTSTRNAIMIVMPSTMMDACNESRELMVASVLQNFQPMAPLVAHFDCELLPNQDGTKSDRMAIVVSDVDIEKLLGLPIIPIGIGQLMGQNIFEFIHDF